MLNSSFVVDFNPVAFSWGLLSIRWYGIAYATGFLAALAIQKSVARAGIFSITVDDIDDLFVWTMVGAVIGGRVGYGLFYNFPAVSSDPLSLLRIWEGGMSFHGGFCGVILAVFLFARRRKIILMEISDIVALSVTPGLFFGRLANFINGELWGRVTDMDWGMIFPGAGFLPRHPTPLYEALGEGLFLGLLLFVIFRLSAKRGFLGATTGSFFLFYGLIRFSIEFFREPDAHIGFPALGLSLGQLLSLPMIPAGIFFLLYAFYGQKKLSSAP